MTIKLISNDLTAQQGTVDAPITDCPEARALVNFFRSLDETRIKPPIEQARLVRDDIVNDTSSLVGVGEAGRRAGQVLNKISERDRPIRTIDVYREELGNGSKELIVPPEEQLAGLFQQLPPPVALVDDTIYRGQTMKGILDRIPSGYYDHIRAIALKGTEGGRERIDNLIPATVGWTVEASSPVIANAADFGNPNGIHRKHKEDIPYYQRSRWMADWFPERHEELVRLCRGLHNRWTKSTS